MHDHDPAAPTAVTADTAAALPAILAERLDGAFGFTGHPGRARAWTALVRRLARGDGGTPVEPAALGADARLLGDLPATEWDGPAIAGSLLTTVPTDHRITHPNGRLWTWCVLDAMVAGIVLPGPVVLESTCAATGAAVEFTMDGGRVVACDAGDRVSLPTSFAPGGGLREDFCCRTRLWRGECDGDDLARLPVAEAMAVAVDVAGRLGIG